MQVKGLPFRFVYVRKVFRHAQLYFFQSQNALFLNFLYWFCCFFPAVCRFLALWRGAQSWLFIEISCFCRHDGLSSNFSRMSVSIFDALRQIKTHPFGNKYEDEGVFCEVILGQTLECSNHRYHHVLLPYIVQCSIWFSIELYQGWVNFCTPYVVELPSCTLRKSCVWLSQSCNESWDFHSTCSAICMQDLWVRLLSFFFFTYIFQILVTRQPFASLNHYFLLGVSTWSMMMVTRDTCMGIWR